jgi:hypothetical protein
MNGASVKNKDGTKGDDAAADFKHRRFVELFQWLGPRKSGVGC